MCYAPAYFRRGAEVSHQADIEALVGQALLMFKYLRMQMLTGGISYQDPATGLNVPARLPTKNIREAWTVDELFESKSASEEFAAGGCVIVSKKLAPEVLQAFRKYSLVGHVAVIRDQYEENGELVDLWPANKITVIDGPAQVGRTFLTTGESPERQPGIWSRCQKKGTRLPVDFNKSPFDPDNTPKFSAVDAVQVGMAGLPLIEAPERVTVYTLA
jgi:hypothetical protein